MIEQSASIDIDISDEDDKIADNNEIEGITPNQFRYDCNFFEEMRKENQGQLEQTRTESELAQSQRNLYQQVPSQSV